VTAECPSSQLRAGQGARKGFASSPGSSVTSGRHTLRCKVVSHHPSIDYGPASGGRLLQRTTPLAIDF